MKVKLTAQGALNVAIGAAVLAVGYGIYRLVKGAGNVTTAVGEAVGGTLYTLVNGDANAQVQALTGNVLADLKANGSPPVGSDLYNKIVAQDGDPLAVLTTNTGG